MLGEVNEFLEETNTEELSDILEVIDAICQFKDIDKKTLTEIQNKKTKIRRKFNKRIILDEIKDKTHTSF